MWNNAEHLEAYFAIPCSGAVLHTLNLRLPATQLAFVINHAGDAGHPGQRLPAAAAGTAAAAASRRSSTWWWCGPGDTSVLDGCRPAVHEYEALLAGSSRSPTTGRSWTSGTRPAMCYTSGTTGDPKGIVYSHRSIYLHSMQVNMAESFSLTDHDTTLPIVPMFHVNAWGIPHAALMTGVNMLLTDRFLQPPAVAEMIETERPTHAAAVPTIWQGLLAELAVSKRDISSLRNVVIGGSACPPSLMRAFQEVHGVMLCHAWGMTEMSPLGTLARPPAGTTGEEAWSYRVTQGRFPATVEARLVGPDGAVMPWDGKSAGELEVRGPWVAAAYYGGAGGEPIRPQDKFRDGWLRTGDVGTVSPDGYLTLTDRAKDVIKSGGEWISSVELENHLMAHPDVAEAAVVAVPDLKWGERPLATVVLQDGSTADYETLRAFLGERVAHWQLPERWALIEAVPKTSVGKFDKKVIRRQYADGELDVTRL